MIPRFFKRDHVERFIAKSRRIVYEMPDAGNNACVYDNWTAGTPVRQLVFCRDECRSGVPGIKMRHDVQYVPAGRPIQSLTYIVRQSALYRIQIRRLGHHEQVAQFRKIFLDDGAVRGPSPALKAREVGLVRLLRAKMAAVDRIDVVPTGDLRKGRLKRLDTSRYRETIVFKDNDPVIMISHVCKRIQHHFFNAKMPFDGVDFPYRKPPGGVHGFNVGVVEFAPTLRAVDPCMDKADMTLPVQAFQNGFKMFRPVVAEYENAEAAFRRIYLLCALLCAQALEEFSAKHGNQLSRLRAASRRVRTNSKAAFVKDIKALLLRWNPMGR